MFRRLGLLLTICVLAFARTVTAQTEVPTAETFPTFPVVQRCISAPTAPPKGWTYPGMILMSGYAGIHAMEADWSTPHVIAQFTADAQGNVPIDGGQLSPDENWYAAPVGEIYDEPTFNSFWIVHELRVYSLSGNGKTITLDLTNYQKSLSGMSAWGFSSVTWRNNQSLTVGELLVYPFLPSIAETKLSDVNDFLTPMVISPDLTRAFNGYDSRSDSDSSELPIPVSAKVGALEYVSWRRDSSGFMAEMLSDKQIWHGLGYFDRDGNLIDHILQFENNSYTVGQLLSGRTELQWSTDDRYFPFVYNTDFSPQELYMVDLQRKQVIDTCLTSWTQPVWSPDGTMFAYLTNAPQNLYLVVVDTKTWKSYIVAIQSGARGEVDHQLPEMIGWHSTSASQ